MASFGDYQFSIYLRGLMGETPKVPVDFANLHARARETMSADIYSYVACGCGDESTHDANVSAFSHWGLVPRMLVDCQTRDLSVQLFGMRFATPLFLCPIGVIGACAKDGHGDLATARAAHETGVPMVASTLSNDPIEEVGKALGTGTGFFQLYTPNDKALTESLVARAEAAGFEALVVTLDSWMLGWRPRDLNAANFPQMRGVALANYFSDPNFRKLLKKPPEEDSATAIQVWARIFGRPLTWADEGPLGRDPEHGGGICQNVHAPAQKRQAASRRTNFDSEKPQTLEKTILGEPSRVDRGIMHTPRRHAGREHQTDHRVPP